MKQILEKLQNKQDLTFKESKTAFEILMTGKASDNEIFNFLTLLSEKGEVSDEKATTMMENGLTNLIIAWEKAREK